ncbi:MAG: sialidase family protein [Sedimentisphaerales bacterium]
MNRCWRVKGMCCGSITALLVCVAISNFFISNDLLAGNPKGIKHITVYREKRRFGGWPANHGIWSWRNEILVGFSCGHYKDLGPNRHAIDRERPEEHLFARSLDGGETWSIENPAEKGVIIPYGAALHGTRSPHLLPKTPLDCPGGVEFTHPDFAMTLRMLDNNVGPSLFYYSYDRGNNWNGPFILKVQKIDGIAARTDYIVNDKLDCMLFLTAAKKNGREGRPFCARTYNGGKNWNFVSWIAPEPKGFSIMPSTVRLSKTALLAAVRRREGNKRWIEIYISEDNGNNWRFLSKPASDLGEGNPPSLIRLTDGRLCLSYGYRAEPYGIRAQISSDNAKTWSKPIHLRDDGASRDLGYVRSVQRSDGKIIFVYYFCDKQSPERYIAATIWDGK